MDIKEVLESEEGKAAIAAAVEAATDTLKANRDDVLGKLKKAQEERDSLATRANELTDAEAKAKAEAALASGDIEVVKAQMQEAHDKAMGVVSSERDGLNTKLNSYVVDQGLTEALIASGVGKDYLPAASALIKATYAHEIGDNDGALFAKFDGKAVNDFASEWASSDAGKHFVSAGDNGGGGSNGANGGGKASGANTMSRSDFGKLDHASQVKFSVDGGNLID